jgi:uncharacterized protein involved in outer membrane biogenesis
MKRFFLITFLSLAVVLLAAIGAVFWLLHDQDWIKGEVQELVTDLTGRQFLIDGPLDIALSANPVVEAQGLSLANAPWADRAEMIQLEKLRVSFDLFSIFSDQFGIHFVEVDGLEVSLAENDQGEVNWDLFPGADEDPEPESKAPPDKLPYRLGRLTVTDFNLSHKAPDRLEPLQFSIAELNSVRLENEQIDATARGSLDGLPLKLDGYLGPLNHLVLGGEMDGKLDLTVGDIELNLQGHVEDSLTFDGIDAVINFTGPEFAWVTQEFRLPDFSSGKFDFYLLLDSTDEGSKIDLVGDLGSLDVNINGEVDELFDANEGHMAFEMAGPDLQKLVATFGEPNLLAEPYQLKGDLSRQNAVTQVHNLTFNIGENRGQISGQIGKWPEMLNSEFDVWLKGPDISVWGPVLRLEGLSTRDYELTGRFANKDTNVILTTTRLDVGDSFIELAGSLGEAPDMIGAALELKAMSPDLAKVRLLSELGDIPAIPVNIQGNLGRNEQAYFLNKLSIDVGGDSLLVDAEIPADDYLQGSEIEARASIRNLGALGTLLGFEGLPQYPVQLSANARLSGGGLEIDVNDSSLGDLGINLQGKSADLNDIKNSSVQFQLAIPSLSNIPYEVEAMKLPDMPGKISGRFDYRDELIVLSDVEGSIGETAFNIDTTLSQKPGFTGSTLAFSVSGPNFTELIPLESLQALPHRFKASGRIVKGSGADQIDALELELGPIKAKVDGTVDDLLNISSAEVTVSASGPDFSVFGPLLQRDVPAEPFRASGRIVWGSGTDRIDGLELELGSIKAKVDGTVDDLLNISSAEVTVSASGSDFSVFGPLLKRDIPADPFSLEASVKGTDHFFDVNPIQVSLGPSDLTGNFTLGTRDRIDFKGQFRSDLLSIAWLTAPKSDQEPETEEQDPADAKPDKVFPDTPIPENPFGKLGVDLEFKAGQIITDATKLRGVNLDLLLKEDLIQVDTSLEGGPLGENLTGNLTFDTSGDEAKLDLTLDAEGFRLGVMAPEGLGEESTPPTNIMIRAAGHGTTWHELASSLNGRFRLHQDSGLIASAGLDLIFSDLLTELLNTLNPFAKDKPYTELECGLIAADMVNGQLTVEPLLFQTKEITIVSGGAIDLVSENITLDFHTQVRKGIGLSAGMIVNPFIRLGGSLASPAIEIDPAAVAVKGTVAVATVGLSILGRSLYDRFLTRKDPCGHALKKLLEADAEKK